MARIGSSGPLTLVALAILSILPAPAAGQSAGSRAADVAFLSGDGPHAVLTYTDMPDVPEFGAATIYYPASTEGRIGGVAIAPGFTELQRHIAWWGPRLASHGYAVLILDTNDPREDPSARAEALIAAVRLLRAEGTRQGSPLFGRIDPAKMAIMGHSMGGGGTLIAANRYPGEIQAAIPFTPWQPNGVFDQIAAPTLVLAGSADRVAPVAGHSWPHFESLPAGTPRIYLEVEGGDHFIANSDRGTDLATMGRYALAWLGLYLNGEERYRDLLFGEIPAEDRGKFSRYVAVP